jgi:cation:H+ antiporter
MAPHSTMCGAIARHTLHATHGNILTVGTHPIYKGILMLTLGMFVAGLLALIAGADLLVRGASKLALSFGLSPLVVGLTIVAFDTSAPEVAVSLGAVLEGQTDIALGNLVGSNIFNVLFILGLSAIITPLVVNIQLIRH